MKYTTTGRQLATCLLMFGLIWPCSAETQSADSQLKQEEATTILKTPQGSQIVAMFREAEKLHAAVLSVTDEKTFFKFRQALVEAEKQINEIASQLAKLEPLSESDQVRLQQVLQKENARITALAERAARYIPSIRNAMLGQKVKREEEEFFNKITPILSEQLRRHCNPPTKKKEQNDAPRGPMAADGANAETKLHDKP